MQKHARSGKAIDLVAYETALKAPMKHSFILKDAGHFAFFTEPQKFSAVMIDILNRTYPQFDRTLRP